MLRRLPCRPHRAGLSSIPTATHNVRVFQEPERYDLLGLINRELPPARGLTTLNVEHVGEAAGRGNILQRVSNLGKGVNGQEGPFGLANILHSAREYTARPIRSGGQ